MKEKEHIALCTSVLFIQFNDSFLGQPQQRLVLRNRFLGRVSKISQQAKVQVFITICQKPNFKRLDQILDVLSAHKHSRDHHESSRFRRNSFGEVHSRSG